MKLCASFPNGEKSDFLLLESANPRSAPLKYFMYTYLIRLTQYDKVGLTRMSPLHSFSPRFDILPFQCCIGYGFLRIARRRPLYFLIWSRCYLTSLRCQNSMIVPNCSCTAQPLCIYFQQLRPLLSLSMSFSTILSPLSNLPRWEKSTPFHIPSSHIYTVMAHPCECITSTGGIFLPQPNERYFRWSVKGHGCSLGLSCRRECRGQRNVL